MENEALTLVGRCGMYCGACDIYRAYRDDGKKLLDLAKSLGCAPGVLRCEGCQADTPARWGSDCAIIACQEERELTYCFQCEEYAAGACEKFAKISSDYAVVGMDLRHNLNMIQAGKAKEWLADQDMRWRCSVCERPIDCWEQECHWCGAGRDGSRIAPT